LADTSRSNKQLKRTVLSEIRKQGVTVLLVEQDVFAAFSVADRGYVMETGRIVRQGLASDLANDESVRHAYLGEAMP
jgi:branched-chain amino acid transport system ATP-binding protein